MSHIVSYNGGVEIPYITHQACKIGSLAAKYLLTCGDYLVKGNTSKGLFLENVTGNLIFLSNESFAGPYTVNSPTDAQASLKNCDAGVTIARWADGHLIFDFCKMRIAINMDCVWLPNGYKKTRADKVDTSGVTGWALAHTEHESLLYKTAQLLEHNPLRKLVDRMDLDEGLQRLHEALRIKNRKDFLKNAYYFVGRGSGLTPSGDDLLCGICLAITRYRSNWMFTEDYAVWMDEIHQIMKQRTTSLSQALFSATMQGLADERLIRSIDALMNNQHVEEVIQPVSTWGSSSGFDTLAGAMLAIHSLELITG